MIIAHTPEIQPPPGITGARHDAKRPAPDRGHELPFTVHLPLVVRQSAPDTNSCEYMRYQLSHDGTVYTEGMSQLPGYDKLADIWVAVGYPGDLAEAILVWTDELPPLIPGFLMNKYNFPRRSLGHGPEYAALLDTQDYLLWHADNAHSNGCGTLHLHGYYAQNNPNLLNVDAVVTLNGDEFAQQLVTLGYAYDPVAGGFVLVQNQYWFETWHGQPQTP